MMKKKPIVIGISTFYLLFELFSDRYLLDSSIWFSRIFVSEIVVIHLFAGYITRSLRIQDLRSTEDAHKKVFDRVHPQLSLWIFSDLISSPRHLLGRSPLLALLVISGIFFFFFSNIGCTSFQFVLIPYNLYPKIPRRTSNLKSAICSNIIFIPNVRVRFTGFTRFYF